MRPFVSNESRRGALADFYERIPKPKAGTVSRVFDPGRIMPEKTRTQAEGMRNERTFVVTTSEFEEIRQRVAALPPAEAKTRESQPSLRKQAGK